MPRKPKHPRDMTNDEAMRHLFGAKGAAHAKRAVSHLEKGADRKAKPQVKSTKKDSK